MPTKKSHAHNMETQLKELGAKLDQWKIKGEQAARDAKVEYKKRLAQYKKAKAKVQALRAPTASAIGSLKSGAEKALKDLKTSFAQAKAQYK